MKRYFRYIGVYAAVIAALYLFMVLAAAIPNDAIKKNMADSARSYSNADQYVFTDDGKMRNVTDNYADVLWLNISWNMGDDNPFTAALDTKYYDGEKLGNMVGLYMTVTKNMAANTNYTRYWHGTAGVLRVMHLFTDVSGAKTIGFAVLVLLILKTMWRLIRDGHLDIALCLALSLIFVQVWNVRLSIEYLPSFLICFALCPSFLRRERRGDHCVECLAAVSGLLTSFFDFLTTETVTILLPLILIIVVRIKEERLGERKEVFKFLLRCLVLWGAAYGAAFLIKWSAVSLVTGENHFALALSSAARRVDGTVTVGLAREKAGAIRALGANFSVLFGGKDRTSYGRAALGLAAFGIVIAFALCLCKGSRKKQGTGYILLLGSVVLLRYCVLANHAYMHSFFTYRALASTIIAVLSALVLKLRPIKKAGEINGTDHSDALS